MRDSSFLKNKLIAHRGCHDIKKSIPENSMLAFEEAIKNNYTIELDVHILKDGNIVVFHDDNIKRMTGIDKNLKDMNYSEMESIRLQKTDQKIPLFKDVLDLVNGKVPLLVELKYDTKCGLLEKEVINILNNYKGKFAVQSFSPLTIRYFRKNAPDYIRGQLVSSFENEKFKIFKKITLGQMIFNFITKPDFISYDIRALPHKKVKRLRAKKLVLGWTIRNKENYEHAKKYCDNCICEGAIIDEINN